jgi:hypothetical protein
MIQLPGAAVRPDAPASAIVRALARSARRKPLTCPYGGASALASRNGPVCQHPCAVVDRWDDRMSLSGMAPKAKRAAPGVPDPRPPSVTFAETMAKLRMPSRSQVLRDYLDDVVAVSETQARAWREQPVMVNAREHLSNEARWLRDSGPLTDDERWTLLDGLGSRLHDLAQHLKVRKVPACLYSALTALAAVIDARGDVDRVWNQALGVLDAFVAEGIPQRRSGVVGPAG